MKKEGLFVDYHDVMGELFKDLLVEVDEAVLSVAKPCTWSSLLCLSAMVSSMHLVTFCTSSTGKRHASEVRDPFFGNGVNDLFNF